MASHDLVTTSILDYINHGSYPESEEISSSTLPSSAVFTLLKSLQSAQEEAKNDIRALSRSTAPDIDEWIARAKELQTDILRSRDTARHIVAEAEAGEVLKAEVEDTGKKVALLEKEVLFNETLTGTLEHIQYANGLIEKAQEKVVIGKVESALESLEDAEASIGAMQEGSTATEVLRGKLGQLREGMVETARECWDGLIAVNVEENKLRIHEEGIAAKVPDSAVTEITLEAIVMGLQGLEIFEPMLQKLSRDIDRAILKPRMSVDSDGQVVKISRHRDELSCSKRKEDTGPESLFQDLHTILDFLSHHLPSSVAIPLSTHLIPLLTTRLETHCLDPAIPVDIKEMPAFQSLLADVSALADYIEEGLGWNGTKGLRDWVKDAPGSWLTKRREVLLGEVRNLVFTGLRETKVVERVETRMMKKENVRMGEGGAGEDEWDSAWDDDAAEEEPGAADLIKQEDPLDDGDASAWGLDDDSSKAKDGSTGDGGGEDDAWGWGDDDTATASQQPASPTTTRKSPSGPTKPNGTSPTEEQALTLRETFTVTAIPNGLLSILQQTVSDAQTLSSPSFASSPLASIASALYTLPTLALAIYRATAPTAYSKLDTGNMLIYNDASRLADLLRSWQANEPSASRLRVGKDVAALEQFAKKAYATEMESQRMILRDLLDGAQGFGSCTQQPFKAECEGAVEAVVDRIRDVHKLWEGVLSTGALLQSLGSLLSSATGKMINEIEELGDIGEAESNQLHALCTRVFTLKDLFATPSPPSESPSEPTHTQTQAGESQDMTFIYTPTWLKFQYLAEILVSSLADIRWMWKEGELSLEFGREEVVELIEALFAESELRRQAVREIRGRGR